VSRCLPLLLPFLLARPLAAGGEVVPPGQKISDLLSPAKEPSGASNREAGAGGSTTFRLLVGAGALLVLGAAVLVARKRRSHFAGALAIEPIDVVGRAALSSKHSIYIVRTAGRRIVLGVAGERMTALAVIEDRGAEPAPASARGFTPRVSDALRRPAAKDLPAADLDPYRKQMERLRGMLRPPFGTSQGGLEEA
jgi:flagellar biogenesis protein FliO